MFILIYYKKDFQRKVGEKMFEVARQSQLAIMDPIECETSVVGGCVSLSVSWFLKYLLW